MEKEYLITALVVAVCAAFVSFGMFLVERLSKARGPARARYLPPLPMHPNLTTDPSGVVYCTFGVLEGPIERTIMVGEVVTLLAQGMLRPEIIATLGASAEVTDQLVKNIVVCYANGVSIYGSPEAEEEEGKQEQSRS